MDASIGDDELVDVVPVAGEAAATAPAATDEQTPQG